MRNIGALTLAFTVLGTVAEVHAQDLPPYVFVSHVLVETKEAATAGMSLVKGGAPIGTLAQRWSLDTPSAERGGKLGIERCNVYTPAFAKFVCAQPLGEVGIVETPFGWHIVIVHARSADVGEVVDREPDYPALRFSPTLVLSCSASGGKGTSIAVSIDEPNTAARVESRNSLLWSNEVRFGVLTSNGLEILIDRTTGAAEMKSLRDNKPISGFQCRPAAKRLF